MIARSSQLAHYAGGYTDAYFEELARAWNDSSDSRSLVLTPAEGLWKRHLGELAGIETRGAPLILSSSGSTDGFKWVLLSRAGILHVLESLQSILGLTRGDHLAITAPAFHCFGTVVGVLLAWKVGCRYSVLPRYSARDWVEKLQHEGCTHLLGVPAVFRDLLALRARARSLRGGVIAGAPVSRALFDAAQEELGLSELTIGYGLTECSPAVSHTRPGYRPLMDHEIGELLPATRISKDASTGEAIVFGPQIAHGIVSGGNLESPREIRTGDLISLEPGSAMRFLGRVSETLNQGGEKLALLEIDRVLNRRFATQGAEFVSFCARDERLGQRLGIAVRGQRPSDAEIREAIAAEFGKFFSSCVIHRVLEFSRLPSGKITRRFEVGTTRQAS